MNIVLFQSGESVEGLDYADPRAVHIRSVLRMKAGDALYVGVVNGLRGKARITHDTRESGMKFEVAWEATVPPQSPIHLLLGIPRPQSARRILREATSMGAGEIHWFNAEKGETGYAGSKLWSAGEWKRHILAGAEQAFTTRIPRMMRHTSLQTFFASNPPAMGATKFALDPYEAEAALCHCAPAKQQPLWLALGAERGWSGGERDLLRAHQFRLYSMGDRILRMETALIAALAVVSAAMERE